jgi:hypothetical protein
MTMNANPVNANGPSLRKLAEVSPANARLMANKNAYVERPWKYLILKVGPRGPQQVCLPSVRGKAHHTFEQAEAFCREGHEIFEIEIAN